MISYGTPISFNAPVTAATAEESIMAAMGGVRLVPVEMDGTLRGGRRVSHINEARVNAVMTTAAKWSLAREAAGIAADAELRAAEAEEDRASFDDVTEGDVFVVVESEIIEYAEGVGEDGELAEVLGFVDDAEGTWVRIKAENGDVLDSHEGNWDDDLTAESVLALMAAYDRATLTAVRVRNGLTAVAA